jgi:hypothetical protein
MIKCAQCRKDFDDQTFLKGASPDGDIQPLYFFKLHFSPKGAHKNITFYDEDIPFCTSYCCTQYHKAKNEKSS